METHIQKITSIENVTYDVLKIRLDKPSGYTFTPGQATEVSIDKDGWKDEKRPFTFTSLPEDEFLEFTIKTYPSHDGVTNQLLHLKPGDKLIIGNVWGAIRYKGEGLFIAGGAGVTPFIAIIRDLYKKQAIGNNKLLFANKTAADIIHENEFRNLLGDQFINILSDEKDTDYYHGFISESFLKKHIDDTGQKFYVCGPPPMMNAVQGYLTGLGVQESAVVVEI